MTAGQTWTRKGWDVKVAKTILIETMASGLETGALRIAGDLPLKTQLLQEVASFELATTAAGNLVLQGGGKGHHADLAIAMALAFFGSEHLAPHGAVVGKVVGWY